MKNRSGEDSQGAKHRQRSFLSHTSSQEIDWKVKQTSPPPIHVFNAKTDELAIIPFENMPIEMQRVAKQLWLDDWYHYQNYGSFRVRNKVFKKLMALEGSRLDIYEGEAV